MFMCQSIPLELYYCVCASLLPTHTNKTVTICNTIKNPPLSIKLASVAPPHGHTYSYVACKEIFAKHIYIYYVILMAIYFRLLAKLMAITEPYI